MNDKKDLRLTPKEVKDGKRNVTAGIRAQQLRDSGKGEKDIRSTLGQEGYEPDVIQRAMNLISRIFGGK